MTDTPCLKCGRQPVFERVARQEPEYLGLVGIRAACRGFSGLVLHHSTPVMWNEKNWAKLAYRRARDAWDCVDGDWPRQWPEGVEMR